MREIDVESDGRRKTVDQRDDSFNQEYPSIPLQQSSEKQRRETSLVFPGFQAKPEESSFHSFAAKFGEEKLGEHRDTSLVFPGFQAELEESDLTAIKSEQADGVPVVPTATGLLAKLDQRPTIRKLNILYPKTNTNQMW